MRALAALAWMAAVVTACSSDDQDHSPSAAKPAQVQSALEPVIVTDSKGMTVYYLDQDTPTKSRCNDNCTQNWPPVRPFPELQSSKTFAVMTRLDGSQQAVFNGHPLYTCIVDKKPGDIKCDGHMGVFHVLRY